MKVPGLARRGSGGLRRALEARPEWWALGLAAVGWAEMLRHGLAHGSHPCCGLSPAGEWLAWMGMIVAMMVPTLRDGIRDVSLRSYRARRQRAIGLYLAGYLGWWTVAGLVVAALRQVPVVRDPRAVAATFALGAMWTLLPVRALWHARCHRRIPLSPLCPRADVDAFRQGAVNGGPCVSMCWPVMVGCAFAGHSPVVMLAGACITIGEKRMYFPRPRPIALGAGALALWALLAPGW